MPAFTFRFETVRRQRRRVVDEIAGRLAQAGRLVREEQGHLRVLQDARVTYRARYTAALAPGVLDTARLQTAVRYAVFLDHAIGEQEHRVAEMQKREADIRQLLIQAEQAKQVFANLKETDREAFYADLSAKERTFFDGIANTVFTAKHQERARLGEA